MKNAIWKKLRSGRVYTIFFCITLCLFIVLSVVRVYTVSESEARTIYEKYSFEAAEAEKKAIILCSVQIASGVLFVIYLFFLLLNRKKYSNRQQVFFGVVVFMLAYVFGYMYFKRDRVKIIPQSNLVFDLAEIYGDDVEFTDEFENDIYEYYVTFANAYNKLLIDGDQLAFFEIFNMEKMIQYDNIVKDFILLQENPQQGYGYASAIIEKDSGFEPKQIPAQSMACGVILHTVSNVHIYADNRTGFKMHVVIDELISGANTMFDIFYGDELIKEAEVDYSVHIKEKKLSTFNIEELKLNKQGDGKIRFVYDGKSYSCDVKKRKCTFKHLEDRIMLHFRTNGIVINKPSGTRYWIN